MSTDAYEITCAEVPGLDGTYVQTKPNYYVHKEGHHVLTRHTTGQWGVGDFKLYNVLAKDAANTPEETKVWQYLTDNIYKNCDFSVVRRLPQQVAPPSQPTQSKIVALSSLPKTEVLSVQSPQQHQVASECFEVHCLDVPAIDGEYVCINAKSKLYQQKGGSYIFTQHTTGQWGVGDGDIYHLLAMDAADTPEETKKWNYFVPSTNNYKTCASGNVRIIRKNTATKEPPQVVAGARSSPVPAASVPLSPTPAAATPNKATLQAPPLQKQTPPPSPLPAPSTTPSAPARSVAAEQAAAPVPPRTSTAPNEEFYSVYCLHQPQINGEYFRSPKNPKTFLKKNDIFILARHTTGQWGVGDGKIYLLLGADATETPEETQKWNYYVPEIYSYRACIPDSVKFTHQNAAAATAIDKSSAPVPAPVPVAAASTSAKATVPTPPPAASAAKSEKANAYAPTLAHAVADVISNKTAVPAIPAVSTKAAVATPAVTEKVTATVPASAVPSNKATAAVPRPAVAASVSLEEQVRVMLGQAKCAQWMQRRDALQAQCDAAKKAKKYTELAQLGKTLAAVQAEAPVGLLSGEEYRTLAARHAELVDKIDAECQKQAEAEDFAALEHYSQLLESLQAMDLSAAGCQPTTHAEAPAHSEHDVSQYLCGNTPIAVSAPLKMSTARTLLKGKFSASVVNTVYNRTTVTEVLCVIKCAMHREGSTSPMDASVAALRSEHSVYEYLQASADGSSGVTGCVQAFSAHPLYHYLVLEDHGQDLTHLLTNELQNGQHVVQSIIEAVQALHSLGVVHGDIKPQNILYRFTNVGKCEVKLCDLDCARKVGEQCPATILGTDFFHAPEVYNAARRNATVRAALEMDLFPLGLVLWQVLQRSSSPALSHTTESQLQECYTDQAKLWEHLPVPSRGQWSYQYLQSLTSLEPHKRTSAATLLKKVQVLGASNAQHGWLQEQERNDYIQKNVSDKLDQANAKLDKVLEMLQTKFDALGQEVVGAAATLRKEMLLGREHGQVLEGMVKATEDALQRLSAPSGSNEPTAGQTATILATLQARIEESIATALAKQPSSRSVLPDRSAAALTELSAQFQTRFGTLSTELRQFMDDQHRAQASSATAMQDQQRQAQQMHQCLTASLQEIRSGVNAIKLEVQQLRQGQEALGRQVATVLAGNAELAAMVRTVISGTHAIPTLAIILPVVSTSWCKIVNPMRLVRNQFRLFFLCSHTNRIAPGGPKGQGYKINVTKQWVQDVAPVVRVGLVLIKLALLSAGLPLPVPDLPALLGAGSLHAKYLDAALHLVQNPAEDSGGSEFDMDKVIDKVTSLGEAHILQEFGVGRGKGGMTLQEGSRKAYETIQEVLTKDGVNIALTSGLRQVTHKGKTAWILDKDDVEAAFKASVV